MNVYEIRSYDDIYSIASRFLTIKKLVINIILKYLISVYYISQKNNIISAKLSIVLV